MCQFLGAENCGVAVERGRTKSRIWMSCPPSLKSTGLSIILRLVFQVMRKMSAPKVTLNIGVGPPILKPTGTLSSFNRFRIPKGRAAGSIKLNTDSWGCNGTDYVIVVGWTKNWGIAQNHQNVYSNIDGWHWISALFPLETNQQSPWHPRHSRHFYSSSNRVFGVPCCFHPRGGWKRTG